MPLVWKQPPLRALLLDAEQDEIVKTMARRVIRRKLIFFMTDGLRLTKPTLSKGPDNGSVLK